MSGASATIPSRFAFRHHRRKGWVAAGARLDVGLEVSLIGLLIFGPLALGVVEPWSKTIVAAVTAAIAAGLLLRRVFVTPIEHVHWGWAFWLPALFVAYAIFQTIPWPVGILKVMAPHTVAMRQELLKDLPHSVSGLDHATISFYPAASLQTLTTVAVSTVVFLATMDLSSDARRIRRFLTVMAAIGGSVAAVALAQDLTSAGAIFWIFPTGGPRANSGPFINHNHFSQYMNLAVGAALALLLLNLIPPSRGQRGKNGLLASARATEARWWPGLVVVIGLIAICLSFSRGGIVSACIALTISVAILASKRRLRGHGWLIAGLAGLAFAGLLYAGYEGVHDRLATISESDDPTSGRSQVYKDIAVAIQRFPIFGTGLGTHEFVYPMFDRSTNPSLAEYADSDWFQAAEELGIVGIAIILGFLTLLHSHFISATRSGVAGLCVAAVGLGYGLIAIIVHSFTDFGQHLPGIAIWTAAICGLLISLGRIARATRHDEVGIPAIGAARRFDWTLDGPRLLQPISLCATAVAAFWILNSDRVAAAEWSRFDALAATISDDEREKPRADTMAELFDAGESAVALQPTNVRYRLWLNWYRWRAVSGMIERTDAGSVKLNAKATVYARHIVDELHRTRLLCPTFGALSVLAGEIEMLELNDPAGPEHVRIGYALARTDPYACFSAGYADASQGNWADANQKFQRACELGGIIGDVIDAYVLRFDRPELALAFSEGRADRLLYLANKLPEGSTGHRSALLKLKTILDAGQGDASTYAAAASLYLKQNDYGVAADYFGRALQDDYGQVQWRYARAMALSKVGQASAAIHEAEICLSLRPTMDSAKDLIERLESEVRN